MISKKNLYPKITSSSQNDDDDDDCHVNDVNVNQSYDVLYVHQGVNFY